MSDGIDTSKDGGILEITINRPKANAIDLRASRRLNDVVSMFRDDPELRVAIITGAGEKFFSTGWDLESRRGRRRLTRTGARAASPDSITRGISTSP